MGIHISNRIISPKNILIFSISAVLAGFIFVSLLILYFPKNNAGSINELSKALDPQNRTIPNIIFDQIATTEPAVFNITKSIAKGGILINYIGPASRLNQNITDNQQVINQVISSKGLITTGQDRWLDNPQIIASNTNFEILDLSRTQKVNDKKPFIDITFGDSVVSSSVNKNENEDFEIKDYSYFMDNNNLKIIYSDISDFLIKIDPKNREIYLKNQTELINKISNIQNQYSNLTLCYNKNILTNSTKLGYLMDQYNYKLTGLSNFDPLTPTENQIKFIKNIAQSLNVNSFFVDKKLPLVDYTNLKSRLELNIVYLDDYNYEDVPDTLTKNLDIISQNQDCTS